MRPQIPLTRDLVLIGGGHTHALVLRKWAMTPLPGTRLTVINPGPEAPYTGMLPGHIAGHYHQDELSIDLVRLTRAAGARLILSHAIGLDPEARRITVADHPDIAYDIASLDIGITAEMPQIPGFADHAVAAKPLGAFATRWASFLDEVRAGKEPPEVAVIGGGIAGAELVLAMSHALRRVTDQASVTLVEATGDLTGTGAKARRMLRDAMARYDVTIRTNARVTEIDAAQIRLAEGAAIPARLTVGAAGALPQAWLAATGLPLQDGFVTVEPDLRVTGIDTLFAAGDCAHMRHAPRPKAGVFAVRAAEILDANLRAVLTGGALRPFNPQRSYLKLISLGEKSALAEKAGVTLSGKWLWWLKDRIDRKFMDGLADLPRMSTGAPPGTVAAGVVEELAGGKPLCGGCGSKLGSATLATALGRLGNVARDDILSTPGDDAAILRVGSARQVISTDHLRAFTHDPVTLTRIAAIHALGDIWAMGATPQSALMTLILPRMAEPLQARTLEEVLQTATDVFRDCGAELVGGHSTMGSEMTVGFTVTGLCDRDPITHRGAMPGDALIMTRPIGTGTLLTAEMAGAASGKDIAAMFARMARPQARSADLLRDAHAMTDVTGFGLAGHLSAICTASGVGASLSMDAIPFHAGAVAMAEAGHRSTLYPANSNAAPVQGAEGARGALLHDPQTAGGLLAAIPPDTADKVVETLLAEGIEAANIGTIEAGDPVIRVI